MYWLSNTQSWVHRFGPSDAYVTLPLKRFMPEGGTLGRSRRKKRAGKSCGQGQQVPPVVPLADLRPEYLLLCAPSFPPALPALSQSQTPIAAIQLLCLGSHLLLALVASAPQSPPHLHQPTQILRDHHPPTPTRALNCWDHQNSSLMFFTERFCPSDTKTMVSFPIL